MLTTLEIPGYGPYVFGRKRIAIPSLPSFHAAASAVTFSSLDYIRAAAKLHPVFKGISNTLGNDRFGVCALVAPFKMQMLFDSASGREPRIPNLTDVLWAYKQLNPGFNANTGAGDNGLELETVITWWIQHGLYQDGYGKIKAAYRVDASSQQEVEEAFEKYGPLYVGCELARAWMQMVRPGFIWPVAGDPDPGLGHSTFWYGFNNPGVFDSTWAMEGTILWPAVKKYFVLPTGEVYAVVPA